MRVRLRDARRAATAAALLAAAVAAAPRAARAEFSLRYFPQYLASDTRDVDAAGRVTTSETTSLDQRFLLDVNRALYPNLQLNLNGLYDWNAGTLTNNGTPGEFDQRNWNLYGVLKAGDRELNGGLQYLRSEQSASVLAGAAATLAPTRITERYGVFGVWAVPDLPRVDALVTRTNQYDSSRLLADLTEDDAMLNALYSLRDWDLAYRFRWSHPVDHLGGADTTTFTNIGFVGYASRFLQDRLSVAATYQLQAQSIDTRVSSTAASESRPVPLVQGLSAIDFGTSAIPGQIRLDPNPGLVDGDFDAGAGLDIGSAPAIAGDLHPRNVGAQVQDLAARIDAVYVYVDRQLSPAIAAGYGWEAYRSDDNLSWTPIAIPGPVLFGTFRNRFEIPVAATTGARYVKVVVRPLNPAATTDPLYQHVLVTEIQAVQILTAAELLGRQDIVSGIATGTLRLKLLRAPNLYYEFSGFLTHTTVRDRVTVNVTNALGLDHPLTPTVTASARAERTDSYEGADLGRTTLSTLGASLGYRPIPTASGSVSYAGQWRGTPAGTAITHTGILFARADPYRGISLSANGAYSLGRLETGRDSRSVTGTFTAAAVPGPALTVSGDYAYSGSTESGLGMPETRATTQRVEGTAIVTPFPALQATVTGARVLANGRWYTLGSLNGSFSPLHGGEVVLSFAYNENLDTSAQYRLRTWGPTIRWNLRSGAFAEASYSDVDSSDLALRSRSHTAIVRLYIPII